MAKRPPLDVLLAEVNHHLPEGLQLRAPITKKAIRYARSCLAFTYQHEEKDSARFLGPLNAALDQIELSLDTQPPPSTSTAPPGPSSTSSQSSSSHSSSQSSSQSSSSSSSSQSSQSTSSTSTTSSSSTENAERWRVPRDDETPAERAFREALEEVERKNREQRSARAAESAAFVAADAARAREALELVDRYFHGDAVVVDTPEAKAIFELRKALLVTLEQRKKRAT